MKESAFFKKAQGRKDVSFGDISKGYRASPGEALWGKKLASAWQAAFLPASAAGPLVPRLPLADLQAVVVSAKFSFANEGVWHASQLKQLICCINIEYL